MSDSDDVASVQVAAREGHAPLRSDRDVVRMSIAAVPRLGVECLARVRAAVVTRRLRVDRR